MNTRPPLTLPGIFALSLAAVASAANPFTLESAMQTPPDTIYAPPQPPSADSGYNEGAVHFEAEARYYTDYIFRGVEIFEVPAHEDSLNLQFDVKASIDLGRAPHPFVQVFANIADSDPISSFQEIRPTVGFDWEIKPLSISAGFTSYLYPDRDALETNEIFARIELDDSALWKSRKPLLTPYVFAAYDIDEYSGVYVEGGVKHVFEFEDTGLSITALAAAAYVNDHEFFVTELGGPDSGFQHYRVGLVGNYSLNELLNISRRYGRWSLQGYLFYTDGIDNDLAASTQIYGGAGIRFSY